LRRLALRIGKTMSSSRNEGGHLRDIEIAAYLDRSLTALERDRIENHLAQCDDCRLHVVESQQLLAKSRRPRRVLVGGSLLAAAAAAAAVVVLLAKPDLDLSGHSDTSRVTRGLNASTPLVVYSPVGSVKSSSPRFVWASAPGAISYRLTLTGGDASPVWSQTGVDTIAALPETVKLLPESRYLWIVDAIISDGTIRSTGSREFRLSR
jgi:hypothetical protein